MSWRVGDNMKAWIGAACVSAVAMGAGCAKPRGVLFDPIRPALVWPPAPDEARIKFVGMLSDSRDLKAGRSRGEVFRAVLRGKRPPIRFSSVHGVAFRRPGVLAVADGGGSAIHILDIQRRTHLRITGWGDQRLGVPLGVVWVGDGLFVTDARRGEVIEFDGTGRFRRVFGGDILKRPVGIAYADERKQLYVVDGDSHDLAVFDLQGKLVKTIGRQGLKPGEFNYPSHVCIRGDRLVVADSGSFRVQLLDLDGKCWKTIGQKGDGAGDFALPKGVALDSQGHVYVVDAQFENIQIFDDKGRLLMAFGEEGRGPGEFWLPAGMVIDEQDRIWVADSGNRRIQIFSFMGTVRGTAL